MSYIYVYIYIYMFHISVAHRGVILYIDFVVRKLHICIVNSYFSFLKLRIELLSFDAKFPAAFDLRVDGKFGVNRARFTGSL